MESERSIKSFEDLDVWKISHELVLKLYKVVESFPDREKYRLTNQLLRAAISIPANISEGTGKRTTKDYIHYLTISRASLFELRYYLILSLDLGYIDSKTKIELTEMTDSIGRMLNGLINSLRKRSC